MGHGMRTGRALGDREQTVAAFVARALGCEATRVVRVDAFATNTVYAVDADGRRFVVKASRMHEGSVEKFDLWAKSRNWVSGIQGLTDPQTLEKATLRQNQLSRPVLRRGGESNLASLSRPVCRRSKVVYIGTRRHRGDARLCRRWALYRREDTPRLRQILRATIRATKCDKLSEEVSS